MNAKVDCPKPDLVIFAHELRQPLASILSAAQWLTEATDHAPDAREMCQIVERQSRFLVRMIEEVLDQRQTSADGLHLRKAWFYLGTVVADAIEATGALLEDRASRLSVLLPPEPLWVYADPLRVQQILINLLTNAAKYTKLGGRIQLVVEVTAGSVNIAVSDDGVGIPGVLLPRVFDLFERSIGSTHAQIAGLGIGLALVKRLVERHDGTITAHSDGVGKGSTFLVRLPHCAPCLHETPPCRRTSETRLSASHRAQIDAMSDA